MDSKKNEDVKQNANCGPFPFSGTYYSDDYTDVYVGNCEELSDKIAKQGHPNITSFEARAKCCDYIYFVSWSNDWGENGFLAELNGNVEVLTNDQHWEVYATGIDFDSSTSGPSHALIKKQIKKATCGKKWVKPFVGQKNNGSGQPFGSKSGISQNANFIWHNSGNDSNPLYPTSPYVPFAGFNHDEFLIFRLPAMALFPRKCAKCVCEPCDCCDDCSGCNSQASEQEEMLANEAQNKFKTIAGALNPGACTGAYTGKPCEQVDLPQIAPCFYLHYGDSATDQIETHDTEIIFLTVCNPYNNVGFKGLRITAITIVPYPGQNPSGEEYIRIVPDEFICFDCIEGCSCKSRELTIITRGLPAGNYSINVDYCIDEVVVQGKFKGNTSFNLPVTMS